MKNRKGEKFITNEGLSLIIIEYYHCKNCTVLFEDGTILKNREYGDCKKGSIKNPNHKSVCGIGYIGEGSYVGCKNKIRNKAYICWKNILIRCYETKDIYKPDYKNAKVCEEWCNFQNFAKWWEENYNPLIMENWHIDKDILIKGNKIYSPQTCCFVPKEINLLFLKSDKIRGIYPIGVTKRGRYFNCTLNLGSKNRYSKSFKTCNEAFNHYKMKKESHIQNIANIYKFQISEKTYKALVNYKVEITD